MTQNLEKKFEIPWMKEGLHFKCTQCGKCCTGSSGFVWVDDEEIKVMAEFLNIQVSDFKKLYTKKVGQKWTLVEKKSQNHSCIFYENQKCRVYGNGCIKRGKQAEGKYYLELPGKVTDA